MSGGRSRFSAYEVSDGGEVRRRVGKPGHPVGRIINVTTDYKGYMRRACVSDEGKPKVLSVHVAVLEAWPASMA